MKAPTPPLTAICTPPRPAGTVSQGATAGTDRKIGLAFAGHCAGVRPWNLILTSAFAQWKTTGSTTALCCGTALARNARARESVADCQQIGAGVTQPSSVKS